MNALFIAYYFPPIGGAGTQRSAKFVKYLPTFGVQPIVVTGSGPTGSRWEPQDSSLMSDLPVSLPIFRAAKPRSSVESFEDWWGSQIIQAGTNASEAHKPSVIVVTLSPYEGLAPALALGSRIGVPVVADLRDPWSLDEVKAYRSRWHRYRDRRAMGAQLAQCAQVIMNTNESAKALLESFGELESHRITVIPNGFDSVDFHNRPPDRQGDRFQIVHTGYLHTQAARTRQHRHGIKRLLGGSMWQINLETRSHVYLLQALEELHRQGLELATRVEIVLAGVLTDIDKEIVDESPIGDQVLQLGYLDHADAVGMMMAADALFLPLHDVPKGKRCRIVPGKTYEYLASGTPIVAAVPPGDTRDLIEESGAGIVVDPADRFGIADAMVKVAKQPGRFRMEPAHLQAFERQQQASDLAQVLRKAVIDPLPAR